MSMLREENKKNKPVVVLKTKAKVPAFEYAIRDLI